MLYRKKSITILTQIRLNDTDLSISKLTVQIELVASAESTGANLQSMLQYRSLAVQYSIQRQFAQEAWYVDLE